LSMGLVRRGSSQLDCEATTKALSSNHIYFVLP
jgi:hypothetical protein